jgi:hypothetical protein
MTAGGAIGVGAENFLYGGRNFLGQVPLNGLYDVNDSGAVAGVIVWAGQLTGAIAVPVPASANGPAVAKTLVPPRR